MVDIHCHIVPAVDDGAESVAVAEAMLVEAASFGITGIATTPHYVPGADDSQTLDRHSVQLGKVKPAGMRLMLSREVRVNSALLTEASFGSLTYGGKGKYILVELPSSEIPTYFDRLLFTMRLDGITPILAHPERNIALINNPRKVIEFVQAGVHLQLTTSSISGALGPTIQRASSAMLRAGIVSFVASDAHNTSTRPFSTWGPCLDTLSEMSLGDIAIERMTTANPASVLDSESLPAIELSPDQEKSFLTLANASGIGAGKKRKRFFFF